MYYIIGIVITLKILIIAVSEIDKATSPFAKEVKTLDVTPPGAAAIIITPIASSGGNGHTKISINPTIGKIITCENNPTKKSFGFIKILKKSSFVKPKPKENIIKAKARGKKTSTTTPIKNIYHLIQEKKIK